jgi:hypothetical protein
MKNNFNEEEYKKLNDFFENNNEFAVFYPCSGQDLKVMNILERWSQFGCFILCDDGNYDHFWNISTENELGLNGFETKQIENLEPEILKKMNKLYHKHYSKLPEKLGYECDYNIKEIVKYTLSNEISFIKIKSEAFSFYHFIQDLLQKKYTILLKLPGIYNGESSTKIVKACQEIMQSPQRVVLSTEFNDLENYITTDRTIYFRENEEQFRIFAKNEELLNKLESLIRGWGIVRRFGL